MSGRVHSFDVFDTCLVRTYFRPSDLFWDLSARSLAAVHPGFGPEERSELARGRVEAEARAGRAAGPREATLAEIYDHFTELKAWGLDPEAMAAAEIALESESVRPIAATLQRIQDLRAAGERIIFASDMYLPERAIRDMLVTAGMATSDDPLYVSSEHGITKRSGELFRLILEREQVAPDNLSHLGDSVLGDFVPARKLGIKSVLFSEAQPTRFERSIADRADGRPAVASRLAGVVRATRLAHVPADEAISPDMAAVAANVVAPVLAGFVLWALEEARTAGLDRLYFVARDGQVLLRIAEAVAHHRETPELRYLHGSRRAWYMPAAQGPADLGFAVLEGQSRAPRSMLEKLGLTPEELETELVGAGFSPERWAEELGAEEVARFWTLLTTPPVVDRVLASAGTARRLALDYFRQEGLLDDSNWALVDVGWSLRTQSSLAAMLRSAGQDHAAGYYMGINKLRFSATEYGRAAGYLVEELEERLSLGATAIFENKGFVDDVLIQATHGPTLGYEGSDDTVAPVLGSVDKSPEEQAMLTAVHSASAALAVELVGAGLEDEAEALKRAARSTLDLFFAHPTRADVAAVGWAALTPDPTQSRSVPLVRKLSVVTLARIARDLLTRARRPSHVANDDKTVPRVLYKDPAWGFSWLEGSVAISGPPARVALMVFRAVQRLRRRRAAILAGVVRRLPDRLTGGRD